MTPEIRTLQSLVANVCQSLQELQSVSGALAQKIELPKELAPWGITAFVQG